MMSTKKISKFNNLPADVIKLLLLDLDLCDISKFFRLSRKFYRLSNDETFWTQYAELQDLPTTIKEVVLLDKYRQFKDLDFRYVKYDKLNRFEWSFDESPVWPGSLKGYELDTGLVSGNLPDKYRRYIVFRKPVILEIPHRGRPEDIENMEDFDDLDRKNKIQFKLKPDTLVGSTLTHLLTEIYRHMYDLTDDEIEDNVDLQAESGVFGEISYDEDRDIYNI